MGNYVYLVIMWLAGLIFIGIGIYAMKRNKPMWFWTGSEVPESKVKDVKAYNRANGKMWCGFSVPLFVSGVLIFLHPVLSILIAALTGTVGVAGIIWCYHRIEEKYFIK